MTASTAGEMTFQHHGRSYHLLIRTARDLQHVVALDEAHWLATGAPVSALNLDPTLLSLVDSDGNRRIMCFEMRAAINWLLALLRNHEGIDAATATLSLDAVNTETDDGKRIHESTVKMLRQLGKSGETTITLDEVRALKRNLEERPVSERGVILPRAITDESVRPLVEDIVATLGGVDHPSGTPGVNETMLNRFLEEAAAHLAWAAESDLPTGEQTTAIMPLGAQTQAAYAAFAALETKIDQYFAQCDAVACDARATAYVLLTDDDLKAADMRDPAAIRALMETSPLAPPTAERLLPLDHDINPAYAVAVGHLRTLAAEPVLGHACPTLSLQDWATLKTTFLAHGEWVARKKGAAVESLGCASLTRYIQPHVRETVKSAITKCTRTALALDNIRLTEKLILYQANMLALANNFVSFPYLYDPQQRAAFEMGTLVIDGRHLTFATKVENRAEHSKMAETSDIFVIYADILDDAGSTLYSVALPVTSGGKGNLCVGKRGLFQSVSGREHDARIVQMIENPISLSETIVAPFQRLGKLLSGRIEAMTAAAEKRLDSTASTALQPTGDATAAAAAPTGGSRGLFAGGIIMGGGVALAALSSAIAYVSKTLAEIGPYKITGGLFLAVLAVIAPASVLALVKLRSRDLSAILEGSGWAINARMRLTFKQGRVFTYAPPYPKDARGIEPRWKTVVLWLLILALLGSIGRAVRILRPARPRPAAVQVP